jgi:hypothetical protein
VMVMIVLLLWVVLSKKDPSLLFEWMDRQFISLILLSDFAAVLSNPVNCQFLKCERSNF